MLTSSSPTPPRVVVVMGVSGSGKSVIGQRLAAAWHGLFHDADAFHPAANVAKMSQAIPLTDEDRQPWLERMRDEIIRSPQDGTTHVLACSALKRAYRHFLRDGRADVWFVYLQGSFDLIHDRISSRQDHFMKADLLRSQFATLEDPSGEPNTLVVSIERTVEEIADAILRQWPTT
jgi:gluconokinase